MRTTGLLGIFQVPLKLVRLFAEGGQTVLPEEEKERHPGYAGQLGGETGRQFAGFIQLEGEKQTGLGLEFVWLFLQGPKDLWRIGDHSTTQCTTRPDPCSPPHPEVTTLADPEKNPEITAVDPYDPRRDRDPREPVDVPRREEPDDDPFEDPQEPPPVHDPGEVPEDEPVRRDPDPKEPARQV